MSYYVIRKYTAEWVDPPLYVLAWADPDGSETIVGGEPGQHRHVAIKACARATRKGVTVLDEETGISILPGENFAEAYAKAIGGNRG